MHNNLIHRDRCVKVDVALSRKSGCRLTPVDFYFSPSCLRNTSRLICSSRLFRSSCARMYSRISFSSNPTVLTQYPFAQKWYPVNLRFLPKYSRWIRIADFPLILPTAFATLYFVFWRDPHTQMHMVRHRVPLHQLDPVLLTHLPNNPPYLPPQSSVQHFLPVLWCGYHVVPTVPSHVRLTSPFSHVVLLSQPWRVRDRRTIFFPLPQLRIGRAYRGPHQRRWLAWFSQCTL